MDWNSIYRDMGLRWELIQSRTGPANERLYSIRITQKVRAVVKRSGELLEFLSLHPITIQHTIVHPRLFLS
jgi:hypothetical protein